MTLLSLLCLLITFAVYCKFAALRTLPGKNLMILVINLFLAQIFFTLGKNMTEDQTLCVVIGMIQYFCWLSMLCSFTVYSFHTFRVFYTFQARPSFETSMFVKYVAVSNLTSTFVVATTIVVSFGYYDDIGYGGEICFLSHMYLRVGVFLTPIVLSVIVNFTYLVVVMFRIVSAEQVQSKTKKETMTKVFSYIISTLNCFQGLFIFGSFVLNKRTFHLIVNRQMQNDSLSVQNISSKIKKNHNGLTSTESIASTEDNTRM